MGNEDKGGLGEKSHVKLGEWRATAICGNDITSSCLYVTALALLWAGPMAPISILLVAGLLWLFRGIYSEVVGALPLNGGAYNALLNTTSKYKASIAACLTILSYLATAVISGSEAIHYVASAWHSFSGLSLSNTEITLLTICLLGLFAWLTIRGIGESSTVALGIFIFHVAVLTLLIAFGVIYVITHGLDLAEANLASPPPQPSRHPLLFGFSVSLLGISGFESSANFVEEQEPGVFPKTLRNMWIAVTFFNISICCLALCIIPLHEIPRFSETLLARLAETSAGQWLSFLISLDAAIVLSGAVLTSFVGVTGLVHRMAIDRCLPQTLLAQSRYGTFYKIILSFFILSSILIYV
ncbi:MAG: APC family permease, partial [Candidatus Dadabacteria bacterium]